MIALMRARLEGREVPAFNEVIQQLQEIAESDDEQGLVP